MLFKVENIIEMHLLHLVRLIVVLWHPIALVIDVFCFSYIDNGPKVFLTVLALYFLYRGRSSI